MRKTRGMLLAICVILYCSPTVAYDIATHYDLSTEAVNRSALMTNDTLLTNLGLRDLSQLFPATPATFLEGNSPEFRYGCLHGRKFAFSKLIACGAEFEDVPGLRSLNHFYDPKYKIPLTVIGLSPGMTSPDWALKDGGGSSANDFSYKDAHDYLYQALTTTTSQTDRDKSWGKLFQSLGQLIHHVQDMAQPQHVRNDQHVDKPIPGLYNPSLYEKYTDDIGTSLQPIMAGPGSAAVFASDGPNGFALPRDFWTNASGTGLAQLTNGNFVSAGTNFQMFHGQPVASARYASPVADAVEEVQVQDLVPAVTPEIQTYCGGSQGCSMTFYSSKGDSGQTQARASTLSIFDQYVKPRPEGYPYNDGSDLVSYSLDRIFSLNRYNFDAAHPRLLPRAVAYSAGLINYFFRGKLEITQPPEGVYAIVDHSQPKDFEQINLHVKNTTPNGEALSGGDLVLIVKYRKNNCYQADLSGEYGSPGKDVESCRAGGLAPELEHENEEIIVSKAISSFSLEAKAETDLTFDFSQSPMPLGVSDVYIQLVYHGKLGSEDGAVVVATKDISEPTYFAYHNDSDYIYIAKHVYTRDQVNANPDLLAQVQPQSCVNYSVSPPVLKAWCLLPFTLNQEWAASGDKAVAKVEGLPARHFVRFAMLTDTAPDPIFKDKLAYCQPSSNPITPQENQLDVAANIYNYSILDPWRGVLGWESWSCVLNGDGSAVGAGDDREKVMDKLNNDEMKPVAASKMPTYTYP